jgi:hypothetical protein
VEVGEPTNPEHRGGRTPESSAPVRRTRTS